MNSQEAWFTFNRLRKQTCLKKQVRWAKMYKNSTAKFFNPICGQWWSYTCCDVQVDVPEHIDFNQLNTEKLLTTSLPTFRSTTFFWQSFWCNGASLADFMTIFLQIIPTHFWIESESKHQQKWMTRQQQLMCSRHFEKRRECGLSCINKHYEFTKLCISRSKR